jgi:hypothetical protein
MLFLQTLNKFHIAIKLPKNQFINSIYYKQPSNNFIIPYLFYTNKLVQKIMKLCSLTYQGHLFSKQWTLITHHACHLTNFQMIQAKWFIYILLFILKEVVIVELCVSDYVTFNGLMNGIDGIFRSSPTYNEKTNIYWIMFQNFKIKTLTRKKKKLLS